MPSLISDARTPRPGAANGVAPKKGVGMVFWIDGAPGMADMVKVEAANSAPYGGLVGPDAAGVSDVFQQPRPDGLPHAKH